MNIAFNTNHHKRVKQNLFKVFRKIYEHRTLKKLQFYSFDSYVLNFNFKKQVTFYADSKTKTEKNYAYLSCQHNSAFAKLEDC